MKKWMALGASLLATTTAFADGAYFNKPEPTMNDGFFVGLGANLNSLNITQNSFGLGISNIATSTGANSNGVASGNGAPFNNISNSIAPGLQFGYLKHIGGTPNLFGFKFSYEYIGSTMPNNDLFIPQIGQTTSAVTGVTSPLFGYVTAASIQPTINHELNLLALFGHSFGNASIYVGAGPALVNMKSGNYNSIGYAIVDGATVNVTGLVNYHTPSVWTWGGTAQLGANYFFSPTWFMDLSYSYTVTGTRTFNYQQNFVNNSTIAGLAYTTSGTLYTKNKISIQNQAVMLSFNKLFDF
jgi:opacity protein-like surface antigen